MNACHKPCIAQHLSCPWYSEQSLSHRKQAKGLFVRSAPLDACDESTWNQNSRSAWAYGDYG